MAGPNKLQQLLLANAATDSPAPPSGFSQAVRFAEWNASKTDFYTTFSAFPGTGVANKVYVAIDTGVQYQWKSGAYSAIGGGGAGFTPRGAWVNSTNYAIGDLVTSGGGSFIATAANINSAPPSSNWQTIALKGDTGDTGAAGSNGAGYTATSATSLALADSGSLTLATQAGLAYTPGARLRLVADGAHWMEGLITAYSGTSLTFSPDLKTGTGTFASWSLSIAGQPAATGASLGNFASGWIGGWTSVTPGQPARLMFRFNVLSSILQAIPSNTDASAWNGSIVVNRPGGSVTMAIAGNVSESPSVFDSDTLLLSLHDDGAGNYIYNQPVLDLHAIAAWLGYDLTSSYAGDVLGASGDDPDISGLSFRMTSDANGVGQVISFSGSGSASGFADSATGVDATSPTGQTQSVVLKPAPTTSANCWIPQIPYMPIGFGYSQGAWNGTIRIGFSFDNTTIAVEVVRFSPGADGPTAIAAQSPVWAEYSGYGNDYPNAALIARFEPNTDILTDFTGGGQWLYFPLLEDVSGW